MKNVLYLSWRRANIRPPLSLRPNLNEDRMIFSKFIKILKKANYTIVWIDECSFNASTFPIYTWSKIGEEADQLIRDTSSRYNCIAALYEKNVYFNLKKESTTEDDFCNFIELLKDELDWMIDKNQLKNRTILMFDNAAIHKTKSVKELLKELELVAFTISPYSPQLNKVEHIFGTLKTNLAHRNLANRDLISIIIEEIKKLNKQ